MRIIEITHKGVTIKIKQVTTQKRGVNYTEYQITDYSTKRRFRHSRATLPDAKVKAKAICEAMAGRKTETLHFKDQYRVDIRCVSDVLIQYGLRLPEAANLSQAANSAPVLAASLASPCLA